MAGFLILHDNVDEMSKLKVYCESVLGDRATKQSAIGRWCFSDLNPALLLTVEGPTVRDDLNIQVCMRNLSEPSIGTERIPLFL